MFWHYRIFRLDDEDGPPGRPRDLGARLWSTGHVGSRLSIGVLDRTSGLSCAM